MGNYNHQVPTPMYGSTAPMNPCQISTAVVHPKDVSHIHISQNKTRQEQVSLVFEQLNKIFVLISS